MVSSGRGAASNDLDAGVGCIVRALALFAVVVSDVVSVFLVKLSQGEAMYWLDMMVLVILAG